MRNVCIILIEKTEGKMPLVRSRCRWEDNIRMNLREIGWELWNGFILVRIGTSGGFL
jgi:hypothetical protein